MTNNKNPFLQSNGYGSCDAVSRLYDVKKFDLDECKRALNVRGLQKTVETAIKSRIRKLEKETHG